jgi:predicted transcriptional regulator
MVTTKTTVYLPAELKKAVERSARLHSISEAEVIRRAIAAAVESPRPTAGLLDAEPFASRMEDLLEGFGER